MSAPKCTQTPSDAPADTQCVNCATADRSDASTALHRAKLARLIAAAFCEAQFNWQTRSDAPALLAELQAAARALMIEPRLIEAIFASIKAGGANEDAYNQVLGHTVRTDCSPYELEYRTAEVFQQSQTLADIAGFYRAFGLDAAGPAMDRADHVATQWEFLATLSIKEALAENQEHSTCCVDAQRAFLSEHAAHWMPAFFARVRRTNPDGFLAAVAALADAVLRQWCLQLHVPLGPAWLELRPVTEEDSTISCGAPGAVELGPTLAAALEERP